MIKQDYLTCFKNTRFVHDTTRVPRSSRSTLYNLYPHYSYLKSLRTPYKNIVPEILGFAYNYNARLMSINPKKNQFC